ncbi:LRR receptor-like serine threonine- kinase GSO2 [Olea europaea subsp. europaea]|uniref:LRR receptor-like serine threonine- kinase GSO2 n=1 Tax=Olea europaea subsp. europaea TaxID=158383 RepID=A0A8S0UFU0_OLEEU|nr:LRR receptor-like serine threonine- kinase GSO2 [Olea europaea subsp. europaea]
MARGSFQLIILVFLFQLLDFKIFKIAYYKQNLHSICRQNEKKVLITFKEALTDPSGRLASWHGEDCCRWNGVSCDNRTGYVIEIKLQNPYPNSFNGDGFIYELGGEVSPSLLDLKYLNHLDLSMNNFGGARIPDFLGSMSKLRYLNLSSASFGGQIPPNLGKLSELEYLDLSYYYNETVGNGLKWISELHLFQCQQVSLPTSFSSVNFTSLSVLDLSYNDFNSTIPEWLFNLNSLKRLDLKSNNLYGVLPDALANLTSLEELDLSHNFNIEGKLPRKLGKLCNLQKLVLANNRVDGDIMEFMDGLSECSNNRLETLDLGFNELTGNLPNSLGRLKNLLYLRLWHNSFQGSIPETIGNLSSLRELYLSCNQMSGKIPVSFGELVSLYAVNMSENMWEGVITEAHLKNLSSLRILSIGQLRPNVSVVFNISSDWMPSFKLVYIKIQACQLGPNFPRWFRNQTKLKTIILNYARITDVIPDWFLNMGLELEELDVAHNQLSGKIPNSLCFSLGSNVDLSSNFFEGPLPLWSTNVTSLYLRDNLFSGPISSNIGIAMPSLIELDITRNNLNGTIPLSIGYLIGLTTLVISNNHLSGSSPQFWEKTPLFRSLNFLKFLSLSNNNLSGEVPSSLGNCTQLRRLDIGDNQFSGKIPVWIGENMPSLLIICLRNNSFTGNIPSEICRLSILHILDISKNNLSGFIPHCVGNLSGFQKVFTFRMAEYGEGLRLITKGGIFRYLSVQQNLVNSMDLSGNNLSGEIPSEFANLFRLETLNLSMNHLSGQIPPAFGKLTWLETLDLSKNQLSGPIPTTLVSLTFLNHLNLSYNKLSGKIPSGNQFQTLIDPSIYMGNDALCGFPLSVECDGEISPLPAQNNWDIDDKNDLEKVWLFSFVGLGFLTGFWAICGSLILKKQWRDAYFKFVERVAARNCVYFA